MLPSGFRPRQPPAMRPRRSAGSCRVTRRATSAFAAACHPAAGTGVYNALIGGARGVDADDVHVVGRRVRVALTRREDMVAEREVARRVLPGTRR